MLPPGVPVPKFDQEVFIDINPADRQFPLKDGAILAFSDALADRSENYPDLKHIIDIALGEPGSGEGEPIIPTLKQFINFTERVVKSSKGMSSNEVGVLITHPSHTWNADFKCKARAENPRRSRSVSLEVYLPSPEPVICKKAIQYSKRRAIKQARTAGRIT